VYLRTGKSTTSKFITILRAGAKVTVLEVADGWATVEVAGLRGYVAAKYLK